VNGGTAKKKIAVTKTVNVQTSIRHAPLSHKDYKRYGAIMAGNPMAILPEMRHGAAG
jgi:hypothetical protein